MLNVVTGGESAEQRAYGDFLSKDERYERTGEFLDIVTSLWRGETVTRDGTHLKVDRARLSRLPDPVPDVYFGASSKATPLITAHIRYPLTAIGGVAHTANRFAPVDHTANAAARPNLITARSRPLAAT
jgi:alkanesulfonate monooxygenase